MRHVLGRGVVKQDRLCRGLEQAGRDAEGQGGAGEERAGVGIEVEALDEGLEVGVGVYGGGIHLPSGGLEGGGVDGGVGDVDEGGAGFVDGEETGRGVGPG